MKIHYARTQYVSAVNHRVGDKCLIPSLQPIEQLAIQRIKIGFDVRIR
jgi:hypothetical protein